MPRETPTISRQSRRLFVRRIERTIETVGQGVIILYALFVFVIWLTSRSMFQISDIRVSGAQASDPRQISQVTREILGEKVLWKIKRNNSVLYPKRQIDETIRAQDPRVKSVGLSVVGKELRIDINEYVPAYLWCPSHKVDVTTFFTFGCYFADEAGHLFAQAPNYSGHPFLVFTAATSADPTLDVAFDSTVYTNEEFFRVKTFLQKVAEEGIVPRIVSRTDVHDYTVISDKSWTILWSSQNNPEESAANLSLVLENVDKLPSGDPDLRLIDLRFGNKVFYK